MTQNRIGSRSGIQQPGVKQFVGISIAGSFFKVLFKLLNFQISHGVGEIAAGGVDDILLYAVDAGVCVNAVSLQKGTQLFFTPVFVMNSQITECINAVGGNGIIL